jgi:hypothetical protein
LLAIIALITALVALSAQLFNLTATTFPYWKPFVQPFQERRAKSTLLSYLPGEARPTCTTDTSDDFRDAVVSVECKSEGTTVVRVSLYEDSKHLYAHYRETLRKAQIVYRQGKGCAEGVSSETRYIEEDTDIPLGRLACWHEHDKVARLEWTVSDVNVEAYALSTGDLQSLYKWWLGFYIQRDNPA